MQFSKRDENRLLEVTLRSGRKEALYRSDVISGAIIASFVERAKGMAIKRAIASGKDEGISEVTCRWRITPSIWKMKFCRDRHHGDWLKLIDYDPDNVVKKKISPSG